MNSITVILPDGSTIMRKPQESLSLEEAQALVGGYVEIVLTSDRRMMMVDEEGILKKKPFNKKASDMTSGHYLAGTAIIVPSGMGWD